MDELKNYIDERTATARDKEAFTFDFGKYKGYHILDVAKDDPQYLKFVYKKAKYRLSPAIHRFIIDNNEHLKSLIEHQERSEIDVF